MSFEQNSIAITETLRMIQLLDLIKSYHYSNQPNIEKNIDKLCTMLCV